MIAMLLRVRGRILIGLVINELNLYIINGFMFWFGLTASREQRWERQLWSRIRLSMISGFPRKRLRETSCYDTKKVCRCGLASVNKSHIAPWPATLTPLIPCPNISTRAQRGYDR